MGYMFSLLRGRVTKYLHPLQRLFIDPFLTSSRPDLIDSALLRPGRLDKSLLCNMPTKEERREVRQAPVIHHCPSTIAIPLINHWYDSKKQQILQAHARKVPVSPDVDFDRLADVTEGFSGADLQALLYNAHLDVVHASVGEVTTSASARESNDSKDRVDDPPIEYTLFGGPAQKTVKSRAEEMAAQRRVRRAAKHKRSTRTSHSNRLTSSSYARSCLRRRAVAPLQAWTR